MSTLASHFGLRSAPFLFNQFANALEWIHQSNLTPPLLTEQHTLPAAKKSANARLATAQKNKKMRTTFTHW